MPSYDTLLYVFTAVRIAVLSIVLIGLITVAVLEIKSRL